MRLIKSDLVFIAFFMLFLVSSMSAITYFKSDNIFDSSITYVNNVKSPYSIIMNFKNIVNSPLVYNVEVIYPKKNLVVSSKNFVCNNNCDEKFIIHNIFFDNYDVIVRVKYNNKFYEKKLSFKLNKINRNNHVYIKPVYYLNEGDSSVLVKGKLFIERKSKVIVEAVSKDNSNIRFKKQIVCNKNCDFNLTLNKNIIIGDYGLNVYLPNDVFSKGFKIKLKKTIDKSSIKNNSSKMVLEELNDSDFVEVIDLFGEKRNISAKLLRETLSNSSNLGLIGFISANSSNNQIDNTDKNKENSNNNYINNTNSKNINLFKPRLKEINEINNVNLRNISTLKTEKKGFTKLSSFSKTTISPNSNPVVYNDTKIFINSNGKYVENISNFNFKSKNKLVPGVYKYEKIIRYKDGTETTETKYFAYGLISINTLKPLYHRDENVDMLIVVLDKWGYLVSNASIVLNITEPSGKIITLSSDNLDIVETEKNGVYKVSIKSGDVGKYLLNAEVNLGDMIVDVSSYFNVIEYYPFDILRDVPATIDPWQGPFRNNFTIKPLFNYKGTYSLIEKFSSDFTNITGNFDLKYILNDSIYLKWDDLHGLENDLYYTAQVPLKSPYLYYLGNAEIIYNEGYSNFYENRSWLFAIDPAAKVCDFNSACICGSSCTGGGEPGDGTIDSCSDGNTNYEYVNDIRVTDLNGSYFGTGDTVEVCVEFNCDSDYGGDIATIGYKDASAGWTNGDIILETGQTNDVDACVGVGQVYCKNITLSNYIGVHNVRGKVVWRGGTNKICDEPTYYDHDDINFTVLPRIPAGFISWDLDNGTNIGNNLNVIRGSNITAFSEWDKPLQNGIITHNGTGSFIDYDVDILNETWINYTFQTNNISIFPNLGPVNLNITSWDLYFNLSNTTSPQKTFYIYGLMKINQTKMEPYIMYNGSKTNIFCQVTDENVPIPYSGVSIDFYNNISGYLGSAISNGTGWGNISYIENNVGIYDIICNVSSDTSNYLMAGNKNQGVQQLIVKKNGTDITPPKINLVNILPSLFSVGGLTTITANVTDEINLTSVYLNVTFPDLSSKVYSMENIGGDIFEFNFTDSTNDGLYKYYIFAYDNSSNEGWSSTYSFIVTGIRTFIGIKTTKDIYKLGEEIYLTTYSKIKTLNNSIFKEGGDVNYIYYNFDSGFEGWSHSGAQDEWENGVPNSGDWNTKCDSGNCISTDLDNDYNNNADEIVQSPILNQSGRKNTVVSYWRTLELQDGTDNDRAYFEGWDGSSWNIYYQDSLKGGGGPYTLSEGVSTYYLSELDGVGDSRIRFRLTSDGSTTYEGWVVDSVNISFDPREDWDKSWINYNNSFGTYEDKITAIKIKVNITSYSSVGSENNKNKIPDLEIQVYNGSGYGGNYKCNLDSSKSYPFICEFIIKNTPEYLTAWKNSNNRSIRIRAMNLDHGDYIEWTNISREYITPSIIENHGLAKVTSYLLEQFKNSTGGIVKTMYNNSIELNASEAKPLDTYWSFKVPDEFGLGYYSAYVALTDAENNVLFNDDDGTPINDSYTFQVQSLLINIINPKKSSTQNESFYVNITLDTTYFSSGGWCAYNLDNTSNITMTQKTSTNFDKLITNLNDGNHILNVYCNDSNNWIVKTGWYNFNVSQNPRISYINPTDLNNSFVNRSWTLINVSINDSSFNSSWLVWNGVKTNDSLICSGSNPSYFCSINKSNLLNGNYSYKICVNDSLNNINCTKTRIININKTLPKITIISPKNNSKFSVLDNIWFNISIDSKSSDLNKVWFVLRNNGTKYYLNNISLYDWNYNLSLKTGYYNVTFYGNDTIGNLFSSVNHNFIVIPDKNIEINKKIISISKNKYLINISVKNRGKWTNYTLYDLVQNNNNYYNLSIINDASTTISGGYSGTDLIWNLNIPYNSTFNILYYFNASFDYNLLNNYIISID